jgi:hypothetical protein
MMCSTIATLVARNDSNEPIKVGIATTFSIGTELSSSMFWLRRGQHGPRRLKS